MFDQLKPIKSIPFEFSSEHQHVEFKLLLKKIYQCYRLMLETEQSLPHDENNLSAVLVTKYIKNIHYKKEKCGIVGYRFEREVMEDHSTKTKNGKKIIGRVDIKILPIEGVDRDNDEAYFVIECKRLDNKNPTGRTGLNAEYVKNGIARFVGEHEQQYSSYYNTNAMMAYIIDSLDINENIKHINELADTHFSAQTKILQKISPIEDKVLYESEHTINAQKKLKLYHVMLDFSDVVHRMI